MVKNDFTFTVELVHNPLCRVGTVPRSYIADVVNAGLRDGRIVRPHDHPFSVACLRTRFSAVGDNGYSRIAFAPAAIMLCRSEIWC
jgi:hypothetical protein